VGVGGDVRGDNMYVQTGYAVCALPEGGYSAKCGAIYEISKLALLEKAERKAKRKNRLKGKKER